MRLASLTRPELIFTSLGASDSDSVLRAFASSLATLGVISNSENLYEKLAERERLGSTGIGDGIAIPHCKLKGLRTPVLSIGLLDGAGVDFGAIDQKPVKVFFLVISPVDSPAEHLQVLASLSRWLRSDKHVEKVIASSGAAEIFALLQREGPS